MALCCGGATGQQSVTAPLQPPEPVWWDPKAEGSMRDLQKITKLTDCVMWATNIKSSTCFIITGLCWCSQKRNNPWRASQFFLGEQDILVLSPSPVQLVDSNWWEWKNVSFISLHRNIQMPFPYSCPYSCLTWQSYIPCNSPTGSTRETTTKTDSLTGNKRDHCTTLHIHFFVQQVTMCTTNCIC